MPLDPEVQNFLDELKALGVPPFHRLSPEEARMLVAAEVRTLPPPLPMARIEDYQVPVSGGTIPIRLYIPHETDSRGVFVYYHGGGWVLGDIATHEPLATEFARAGRCRVVSVGYRLAPEHKFPTAAEDAYAAAHWVVENAWRFGGNPDQVALGGDSAGGNLAAVVAMMARDRASFRPVFQVLIYPVTDYNLDTPSYHENAEGYLLTREDMRWFWGHYLAREEDGSHPYASPLRAEDFRNLPPALVLTAQYDPLRDEGEAYAARLKAAGVKVQRYCYEGLIHAFVRRYDRFSKGREAIDQIGQALREVFHAPAT